MTIEDQIKDEKLQYYNITKTTILIEKLRKYLLYHQVNLINMNALLVKKYYHRINSK